MRPLSCIALCALLVAGCRAPGTGTSFPTAAPAAAAPASQTTLRAARAGFVTKITRPQKPSGPCDEPPPAVFRKVSYQAAPGAMAAYLTPDPRDGRKHPAIVWITGGDCNSIGDVWTAQQADNDQSAAAYRQAGIVMMFPSLRGGNNNPGQHESFLGEVDDVIAAADYLAQQSYVDPARIYLGGHSTGGTLALLVSECTDRFRAVFSFGPVENAASYGERFNTYDINDRAERRVRAPVLWLHCIASPTFIMEGSSAQGTSNIDALRFMEKYNTNRQAHFLAVPGADHFTILAPTNRFLAAQIVRDTGATCRISFTASDLAQNFANAGGR